jgi:hypothetical protein
MRRIAVLIGLGDGDPESAAPANMLVSTLGEAHLRRILKTYAGYYNKIRTHRSLDKDAPAFRPVQRVGNIASHAILGGLHHHYVRI